MREMLNGCIAKNQITKGKTDQFKVGLCLQNAFVTLTGLLFSFRINLFPHIICILLNYS